MISVVGYDWSLLFRDMLGGKSLIAAGLEAGDSSGSNGIVDRFLRDTKSEFSL